MHSLIQWRKITGIYGLYSAVKWRDFLSQYHCLHLFSIKMLLYGIGWNRFSGWNSFMEIIPRRLENRAQSYIYVLPCHVKQCSLLFSASPGLSPSVLTPSSCRVCGLKYGKLFFPIFPYENVCVCVCQELCFTGALFSILISPREEWNLQQQSRAVIILYCLILQILRFNRLSIYIPAIDLAFSLCA